MGTDDYVRPIYPEDDMDIVGDYLMCRFYPDFTQTRLDMGLPYPIPEEKRQAFNDELFRRITPEEQERFHEREKGGRTTTLGLWMFATDAREPLKEVMMRYVILLNRAKSRVVAFRRVLSTCDGYGPLERYSSPMIPLRVATMLHKSTIVSS